MEYKIRANNQKEAVEVYKTIRQIQQSKHNIAINADSRKDAVRIYKEAKRVCDSKKVKDSYVEIEGDWDYDAAKAAEKLGLKFKYTGKRYNGYPEARIEGDKQKILTFMRKWYDPDWQLSDIDDSKKVKDSIVGNMEAYEWWNKHDATGYWDDDLILEWPYDTKKRATEYFNEMKSALPNVKMHLAKKRNRYVIVFDSKFTDSKLKDKQNLVRGDWFVFRSDILSDLSRKPIYLYKVLDTDLNRGNNISVDTYVISLGTDGKLRLKRYTSWGSSIKVDKDIVKFNSADEALKWAKQKVATYNSTIDSTKVKDFGMHNPATTNYHPEYSPVNFKRYVTNIVKLDLSTKTFTPYNPSKANAIKRLETYVSQVIDDFKADIANPRVIRNEAVTWYNNNYTKILDMLLKTPSIIQHMDGTSLVNANNLLQQMQQSIK